MNNAIVEVLAPAGSPEALTAAVRCGAAAVYLGAERFNARRAAHNFTDEDLKAAVAYCHARQVAVYLTLNTLLRQEELEEAVTLAVAAAEIGVDAIIVQDLGLTRRLRTVMPTMPLHASTQLSCHTPAGVAFLRDVGFTRVVLAREMTRKDIAACTHLGVETEVFVHGALCMSVSGQCYLSAMLGGRSGNRGACAQPCRLPFAPAGKHRSPCHPNKAALSLKDNCLAAYVKDLAELGVTSLKIEGRMKRPEYVAAATRVYSAAASGQDVPTEALDTLKKVFSRTGFTDGYYTDRRGSDMFGVRRKEDVTAASDVLKCLQRTYDKELPTIGVDIVFSTNSAVSRLTATDGKHTVTITDGGGEIARNRPLDTHRATEQLKKTGGTPFYANHIVCDISQGLTLPLSQLNSMRRQALEALLVKRETTSSVICYRQASPPSVQPITSPIRGRLVRLANVEQYSPDMAADMIFLPAATSADTIRCLVDSGQVVGIDIPRGLFGQEDAMAVTLKKAADSGAVAALCGNIGAIPLAKEAGLLSIGGFGLNLTNREALSLYTCSGLAAATLSMELTLQQMTTLLPAPLPTGIMVYGRQPLMLTRNCPRRCAGEDCGACKGQGLVDRTGTCFPVMCAGGCAEILNSVPLYWGDRLQELPKVDFHLYHFTTENAAEAAAILNAYATGGKPPAAITRGLYRRGVD